MGFDKMEDNVYLLRIVKKDASETLTEEEANSLRDRMNKAFRGRNVHLRVQEPYIFNGQGLFLSTPVETAINFQVYNDGKFRKVLEENGILEGLVLRSGYVEGFSERRGRVAKDY